jgi:hypothetical protein
LLISEAHGILSSDSRRDKDMAENFIQAPATNRFQVVHFVHAKRFDEAQAVGPNGLRFAAGMTLISMEIRR